MKKFLSLTFACVGIMSNAYAMEQPSDQTGQPADALSYLVANMPNWIDDNLDIGSLISFSRVCKSFKKICDDKELIKERIQEAKKFIIDPDSYPLLEDGMGQEVFSCPRNDSRGYDTYKKVRIVKRLFSEQAKRYFGDHSVYCVMLDDKMIRCFSHWQMPAQGNRVSDKTLLSADCDYWVDTCISNALKQYVEQELAIIKPLVGSFYWANHCQHTSGMVVRKKLVISGFSLQAVAEFTLARDKDKIKSFGALMVYLLLRQHGVAIKRSILETCLSRHDKFCVVEE